MTSAPCTGVEAAAMAGSGATIGVSRGATEASGAKAAAGLIAESSEETGAVGA